MIHVEDISQELEKRIRLVCNPQARYRVLWLVGKPLSGKTTIVHHLCSVQGWRYINFTLDSGFLDILTGREEMYLPENFIVDFSEWCSNTQEDVIIFDEIEALLALWSREQQEFFVRKIGRNTRLPVGVVFVTRIFTPQQLNKTLSDIHQDHIYEVPQGANL